MWAKGVLLILNGAFFIMIRISLKNSLLIILFTCIFSTSVFSEQLSPPRHQTIDSFGVNVATGHISVSLDTVAIGGELGLAHKIETHQNNFIYAARRNSGDWLGGLTAFNDQYFGSARYTQITQPYGVIEGVSETEVRLDGQTFDNFYVMRVHDYLGSQDFKIIVNGSVVGTAPTGLDYSYEALRDPRHKLVVVGENLEWTKPDGTVTIFQRGVNATAGAKGYIDKIIFPNGFEITVNRERDIVHSVTTNTGFQLKYIYEVDTRTATYTGNLDLGFIARTQSSEGWSRINPKYIVGINNSVEYCNPVAHATCSIASTWPKVTFNWPVGSPYSMYFGDSNFEVVHPDDTKTIYYLEAQDLRKSSPNSTPNTGILGSPVVAPRLAGIKSKTSSSRDVNYTYRNNIIPVSTQSTSGGRIGDTAGQVYLAEGKEGSSGYIWFYPLDPGGLNTYSAGGEISRLEQTADMGGILKYVDSKFGYYNFSQTISNHVTSFKKPNGVAESYFYERGNVDQLTIGGLSGVITKAKYADSCTNQNYKYCNSAEWIEDGKGNRTYYTYHSDSGQVESVIYPANPQGITAQTRYTYEKKFAKRKTSTSGNPVSYSEGIWLKVSESYCINSNYNNGCEQNDEVTTRYEYNSNNLYLTAMIVESGGEERRTCYAYDVYGNLISQTSPNANLSSCPAS